MTSPINDKTGVPDFTGIFSSDFLTIARGRPDHPAISDTPHDRIWTYAELDDLTNRIGGWFADLAVERSGPVAVVLPNSIETLALFFGAIKAGVDYAPVSPNLSPYEMERVIDLLRPAFFLVPTDVSLLSAKGVLAEKDTFSIPLDGKFEFVPTSSSVFTKPKPCSRIFISTSGSTGEPKAVVLDADRLWSSGKAFISQYKLSHESKFLNCLPMQVLPGLYNLGLVPLSIGATIVVAEPFSARNLFRFWKDVEDYKIDILWLVPTIIRTLLGLEGRGENRHRAMAKRVRMAFLGTAPVDLPTKRRFEDTFGIPLLENYALSETLFLTSESLEGRKSRVSSSVGEVLPFVEFRVAAPEDENAKGSVEVRTPYLFLGYLNRAGTVDLPLTPDGFFRTGDLGRITADGTVVLEGRTRDMIKKAGNYVGLREVECLAETHPHVREAVAVAVQHPIYGEDYILFVTPQPDLQENVEGALSKDLQGWMENRLSRSKWPQRVELRSEFPRTASGKIRKHLIQL